MKCPKCDVALAQVYLREVPIEQCLTCSGIWLDSGEFDLIASREKNEQGWFSKAFSGMLESVRKSQTEKQNIGAPATVAMPSPPPTHD